MHEKSINQSLHNSIISDHPGFWTERRSSILNQLLHNKNDDTPYSNESISDFIVSESRKHGCSRHVIRKVLEKVNESSLIRVPLPAEKIPNPRPSLLPIIPDDYSALPQIWDLYTASKTGKLPDLLYCAILLTIECGITDPALSWLLSNLKHSHINTEDCTVKIPANLKDLKNGAHIFPIPVSLQSIFSKENSSAKQRSRYLFLPNNSGQSTRKRLIKKELSKLFKKYQREMFISHKQKHLVSWTSFTRAAPLTPVIRAELEPFITTVASSLPATSSHISSSSRPLLNSDLLNDNYDLIGKTSDKCLKNKTEDKYPFRDKANHTYTDWLPNSRRIISRLNACLKNITDRGFNTIKRVAEAHAIIDELLVEASKLAPNTSALHLALFWIKSRLDKEKLSSNPKASTIETDLSRVFTRRLLKHPDSIDMSDWEPLDLELLIYEYLEDPRIANNTRKALSVSLKQAFGYGIKKGLLPPIDIPLIRSEVHGGVSRPIVLGLYEFDSFISNLISSGTRDNKIIAITSILGFYGGMRACEANSLTVADIIYGDDELIIQIKKGKSQAARRNIPLHLLAPPHYCQLIISWCEQRKKEKRISVHLKKTALFGPENNPDSYNRSELIGVVITHLKAWFGDDIVFHSLRHSFASWLLIRWYALRYPDITDKLVAKDHAIFSDASNLKLGQYFSLVQDQLPEKYEPHHLIMISKLMGHLGQKTLFQYYVHIFHIIHQHATRRVHKKLKELM